MYNAIVPYFNIYMNRKLYSRIFTHCAASQTSCMYNALLTISPVHP